MDNPLTRCVLDSCIWIAAIKSAQHEEGTSKSIQKAVIDLFERIDAGELTLIVPTVVIAEVHQLGLRDEDRFMSILHGNHVIQAALDAETAREAARYARTSATVGAKLKTIDAIILATAVRHNASHLFTTDKKMVGACKKLSLPATLYVGPPNNQPREGSFPSDAWGAALLYARSIPSLQTRSSGPHSPRAASSLI